DDAGRLTSESLTAEGETYTIQYEFDGANRLATTTYPDGKVVERTYTVRDQLEVLTYDGVDVEERSYDPGARLEVTCHANGKTTPRAYRSDDLTQSISVPGVTAFVYSYDANKNKTAETISGTMAGYGFTTGTSGYDDRDRLVAWNRDDSAISQS